MPLWTDRYLILLGTVAIALSVGIGYQYAMKFTHASSPRTCSLKTSSWAKHALHDVQLPSTLPNVRLGSKRHLFFPVDISRVDMLADLPSDVPVAKPLLDKVLFVPKMFGQGHDT